MKHICLRCHRGEGKVECCRTQLLLPSPQEWLLVHLLSLIKLDHNQLVSVCTKGDEKVILKGCDCSCVSGGPVEGTSESSGEGQCMEGTGKLVTHIVLMREAFPD